MKKKCYIVVAALLLIAGTASAQVVSLKSGAWNSDTTWVGGTVPTAGSNVVIDTGMTVSLNIATAECNNLTVNGTLAFIDAAGLGLTVHGDMTIGVKGAFNTAQTNTVTAARNCRVELFKNLTVTAGGKFDMRRGSGALVGVGRVIFTGTANSVINLSQTVYASTIEEFNTVVINKSGGAKVILASGNLFQNNNTTNSADTLLFISGMIETGNNFWVNLSTSGAAVTGASSTSYVNGILGRGLSNSNPATRKLEVGDSTGYRPVTVQTTVSGVATGHHVWAKIVKGDANTGSSTLNGGIDKVSKVRYAQVGYVSGAGAASMSFCRFSPSYGTDDGVTAGNQELRVAYSTNNRATWLAIGPTTDTTSLTNPPTTIRSDSLTTAYVIPGGQSIYVAIARATGTTKNSLESGGTAVRDENNAPVSFGLSQNYPNPFNPSTSIQYRIGTSGNVTLNVYDLLGKQVASVVDEHQEAGEYTVQFNAGDLSSGMYFYTLRSGNAVEYKKMMLLK